MATDQKEGNSELKLVKRHLKNWLYVISYSCGGAGKIYQRWSEYRK